jgi:protease-4
MMFNTQNLLNNKLGITFDVEKNAPYADFPNMNRPMTEQEKTFMQVGVDSVYMRFKTHVAEGRKLDIAYVDSIGQGRVWSGTAALNNRLIDAFGGLDRAIRSAATIAKVNNYKIVTYPIVKDKMQQIMDLLQNKTDKETLAKSLAENQLSNRFKWYDSIKTLLDNPTHTWMMMPFQPDIR